MVHINPKGFFRTAKAACAIALILFSLAGSGLHAQEVSALTGKPPRFGDRHEWVIEQVTQPSDGSFGNVQMAPDGSLYWTGYYSSGELVGYTGIFHDGKPVKAYEGLPISLMDVRAGHLCVAIYNKGETSRDFWYSVRIDGKEAYQTKINVNLPTFDRNRGDYLWARFQDDYRIKPDVVFGNGSHVSALDLVPAQGYWLPSTDSHHHAWPIGYTGGKVYLEVTEFGGINDGKVDVHTDIVDGSTKRVMSFGPIVNLDRATMAGDFVLALGEDPSGAKRMVLRNVRTGRNLNVPFPGGLSDPTILQVNATGQIFYSEMVVEKAANIYVLIGNGRQWLKPLVVSGAEMWPQEWRGNQVVWQGQGGQILRATYRQIHRRNK